MADLSTLSAQQNITSTDLPSMILALAEVSTDTEDVELKKRIVGIAEYAGYSLTNSRQASRLARVAAASAATQAQLELQQLRLQNYQLELQGWIANGSKPADKPTAP